MHDGASATSKRVAVLSYNNVGNFGDRLGYHIINSVLPANAVVTHLNFRPWSPPDENYDLLILGIGNSLFGDLINDDLLAFMKRSKATIGIFGTQYHEAMPRAKLDQLLGKLTHWYARYEDDVFRYGNGLNNVSHLGDWLVTAFPMTHATRSGQFIIDDKIKKNLPLDRTIQTIQNYKTVFSTRLHPLLCALTSAENVGYREQRELAGHASGKFDAMLHDVFGRTYPEDTLWSVDRDKVIAYKMAVGAKVDGLRTHIRKLAA